MQGVLEKLGAKFRFLYAYFAAIISNPYKMGPIKKEGLCSPLQ
ncbi:hypothetical protein MNBD_ALPHA11-656 [hydrothermal vent metagenome]|uniref:Uncharacterized protein n=1 Tax=hydrothermal vent metagenome TaxID=652676 RepID=A0A3B0U166_9ZZZZ